MKLDPRDFEPWLIRLYGRPAELAANVVCVAVNDCGNPGCDGKCRAVALDVRVDDGIVATCFDPDPARELAFRILEIADRIDPAGAAKRKGS